MNGFVNLQLRCPSNLQPAIPTEPIRQLHQQRRPHRLWRLPQRRPRLVGCTGRFVVEAFQQRQGVAGGFLLRLDDLQMRRLAKIRKTAEKLAILTTNKTNYGHFLPIK